MRVSRLIQFSFIAIATGSAIVLGTFIGAAFRGGEPSIALLPFEAISQELDESGSTEEVVQRRRPGDLLRSLNLSRRQKAQLFDIQGQYKSEIQTRREKLRSEITTLRQLMVSDVPAAEVSTQFDQVQDSRRELNDINFKGYLAIREVLTLEQRQIFSDQLQDQKQLRRQRMRLNQPR